MLPIWGQVLSPSGPSGSIPAVKGVSRRGEPPFPRLRRMIVPWTKRLKEAFSKGVGWKKASL